MYKTSNAFNVLQAIAVTAGLALIFWSIGLPSFRFAEAAAVTSFSDTLSDSGPSASSDHDISFVSTSGVSSGGQTIVVTFDPAAQSFDLGSIAVGDIDLIIDSSSVDITGTAWSTTISTAADTITFTSVAGSVVAGNTVEVLVGQNASGGSNQITNPASTGSYEVSVAAGPDDGTTEVAIVDAVTVSAAVDTVFTFAVAGVAGGTAVGGTYSTGGGTSSTSIPFGELTSGVASTAAQQLAVSTNASNGFNVTVQVDQQLTSASLSADIDGYIDGAFTSTPTGWTAPAGTVGSEETYGHWGISSDDTTNMPLNYNDGADFVSASTSPVTVFSHNGVANGTTQGQGTTTVIYRAEISALQEAGNDYTAALTYVATPIF